MMGERHFSWVEGGENWTDFLLGRRGVIYDLWIYFFF